MNGVLAFQRITIEFLLFSNMNTNTMNSPRNWHILFHVHHLIRNLLKSALRVRLGSVRIKLGSTQLPLRRYRALTHTLTFIILFLMVRCSVVVCSLNPIQMLGVLNGHYVPKSSFPETNNK